VNFLLKIIEILCSLSVSVNSGRSGIREPKLSGTRNFG
jgi:hypothetical protein